MLLEELAGSTAARESVPGTVEIQRGTHSPFAVASSVAQDDDPVASSTLQVVDDSEWSALSPYTLRFADAEHEAGFQAEWSAYLARTWDLVAPCLSVLTTAALMAKARGSAIEAEHLERSTPLQRMLLFMSPLVLRVAPYWAHILLGHARYARHRTLVMAAVRLVGRFANYFMFGLMPLAGLPCGMLRTIVVDMCFTGALAFPAFFFTSFKHHIAIQALSLVATLTIIASWPGGLCAAISQVAVSAAASAGTAATAAATPPASAAGAAAAAAWGQCASLPLPSTAAAEALDQGARIGAAACPGLVTLVDLLLPPSLLTFSSGRKDDAYASTAVALFRGVAGTAAPAALNGTLPPCAAASGVTAASAAAAVGNAELLRGPYGTVLLGPVYRMCLPALGITAVLMMAPVTLLLYILELRTRVAFLRRRGVRQVPSCEAHEAKLLAVLGPIASIVLLGVL